MHRTTRAFTTAFSSPRNCDNGYLCGIIIWIWWQIKKNIYLKHLFKSFVFLKAIAINLGPYTSLCLISKLMKPVLFPFSSTRG